MKLKNFWGIKAIDEARAKKIIKWYEKANYRIGFMASSKGPGATLDSISVIKLLSVFSNSEDFKRDFERFNNEIFEGLRDYEGNNLEKDHKL
ncbi:hypothetical protein ES705_46941 [subsurface metagenome]